MRIFFRVCILLLMSGVAWAERVDEIFYDGRPLEIHVAEGKITQVQLPEKIAKIIKGGEQNTVLIEVLGDSVFLLPKDDNPADVFVTTQKGESYPLNLIVDERYQAKVKVSYAFAPRPSSQEGRRDVMDLMKVVLQGRVPAGATVIESDERRLISNGQVELSLKTVFELPNLKALVFSARNLSDNTQVLPVQALGYSRLLAIASDSDTLAAKGQGESQTNIYMVIAHGR